MEVTHLRAEAAVEGADLTPLGETFVAELDLGPLTLRACGESPQLVGVLRKGRGGSGRECGVWGVGRGLGTPMCLRGMIWGEEKERAGECRAGGAAGG